MTCVQVGIRWREATHSQPAPSGTCLHPMIQVQHCRLLIHKEGVGAEGRDGQELGLGDKRTGVQASSLSITAISP